MGIAPAQVTELNEEEKARLEQLMKQLGDMAPQPAEPVPQDEQGMVGVLWHRIPGNIGGQTIDSERVVGFVRIVATSNGQLALSDPEPRANAVREMHPDAPRLYVNVVDFGQPFLLTEADAAWAEPVSAAEMPESERLALIDEYAELARKAGLL